MLWTHQAQLTFLSKTFENSLNVQKQYEKIVWEKSNDAYSLSITVRTMINHILICFLQQYQHKKMICVRTRTEIGIARHIDVNSIWTLNDNGILANQIMRLAAIVVKIGLHSTSYVIVKMS